MKYEIEWYEEGVYVVIERETGDIKRMGSLFSCQYYVSVMENR